ncbi:beta-ketoacyl synthase N-terminal-like domain-containing protein [Streptomyces sp. NPDC006012]|uniref:type I polyketide synthase n=1 Tax=Streptomyces sp. NPDC006012 TaxID=3364739 RepID=UPI003690D012
MERIAIVGMAALMPGAATLDAYWRNLVDGVDAITDVPEGRWDPEFRAVGRSHASDRIYCRRGGFIDDLATFEPLRYGIMPNSVADMEPDQLISLEVAAAAVEDAGGAERMPDADRIGVILGRGGTLSSAQARFSHRIRVPTQIVKSLRELFPELSDDRLEQVQRRLDEEMGPQQADGVLGVTPNLAASRIANRLNLRGPAYTIDAACASSLIAVEHAVSQLAGGQLDAVLTGGTHHTHDVTFWSAFSQLGAVSRQGQIRPFDAAADGLLIGEGTGVVVLKRLADAVRDGDRVYAVIRGTGTSSDGRSASMFNPVTDGQVVALRRAWQAAGLDPRAADAVGLLEAHGTATPTGDASELRAVAEVFGGDDRGSRAVIGSVKSMIGHTMPAAGVAGLIKAALAVHHGVQLPTLHCDRPRDELEQTRFTPLTAARPWEGTGPRRAAVNAFGFGGINAHVIIEEHVAPARHTATRVSPVGTQPLSVLEPDELLWLSAADPTALAAVLDGDDHSVRRLSRDRSPATGSTPEGPCRIGVVNPTDKRLSAARRLVERGDAWRGGRDIWFAPRPLLGPGGGRLAFVFPGIEADFSPRTADIAAHFGLRDRPWSASDLGQHGAGLTEVGSLLSDALRRTGIVPDAVAGHSIGEWTAAIVSGQMNRADIDEFLRLFDAGSVEVTGRVFAAVSTGADAVSSVLGRYPDVVITHDNAPNQCVVNGPEQQVEALITELRTRHVICQTLPFRAAFHTPGFSDGLRSISEALPHRQVRQPTLPVWSATLAAPFPTDPDEVNTLFARHMVEPVRFRPMINAMYEAGIRAFLQVGVGQLPALIQDNLQGREHLAMPVNVPRRSGLEQLRRVATALWVDGADPDPRVLSETPASAPAVTRRPAMPGPHRGPVLRLNLATPLATLGENAAELLNEAAATNAPAVVEASRPATPAPNVRAPIPAAAPNVRAPMPAAAPPARAPEPTGAENALSVLRNLAGDSSAAAELMGLLEQTAQDAAVVMKAGSRPPARSAANVATAPSAPRARQAAPSAASASPAQLNDQAVRTTLKVSLDTMPYLIDHCFFLQPDDWPHPEDRWPVMAATTVVHHMVEAVRRVAPGLRPVEVRQARFHRWLLAAPATEVEVTVKPVAPGQWSVTFGGHAGATVVMAAGFPSDRPTPWAKETTEVQPPAITAEQLYRDRLLFHGPQFQGITDIQAIGDTFVRGLITAPEAPGALLDNLAQLLAAWLNTMHPDRPVVLPVAMNGIRFFGPAPEPGTEVTGLARIKKLDNGQLVADLQMLHGGRVWAQIDDITERRFDSGPDNRLAEQFPGRHPMTIVQPEGWTMAFDWWTDPVARDMAAFSLIGRQAATEYERMLPKARRQWLLGRIAAKDAVRHRLWEENSGDVYPIEVGIGNDETGRPCFRPRPDAAFVDCDLSLAHCAEIGVAVAQQYDADADRTAPGVGIDVVEVTAREESTLQYALTPDELTLLDTVAGGERNLWFARFWAAKEAVGKAERTGLDGNPRRFVVQAHDAVGLRVTTGTRTYRVGLREVANPPGLPARQYVVAWTWGPVD